MPRGRGLSRGTSFFPDRERLPLFPDAILPLRIFLLELCALASPPFAATAGSFEFAPPPDGRNIRIAVVILKAKNPAPGALPVFFLNGGPGGSCTAFGEKFPVFAAIQQHRDVFLIDQRGVGFSLPYLALSAANDRDIRSARDAYRARGIDLRPTPQPRTPPISMPSASPWGCRRSSSSATPMAVSWPKPSCAPTPPASPTPSSTA